MRHNPNVKPQQMAAKPDRSRLWYAITTLVVIGLGLASRSFPGLFPQFVGKYPGDAFWALMIFFAWGVNFPSISTARLAGYALATCYFVECSQLYHAPWLDNIRSTTLGHLVLGSGFMWGDLVAYAIGVCVGVLVERATRSAIAARTGSAST